MKKVIIVIKETGEALTITMSDLKGYFPNEKDGSFVALKRKVLSGTQAEEIYKKLASEKFDIAESDISESDISDKMAWTVMSNGSNLLFHGYMEVTKGKLEQFDKYFDVEFDGDLLGLCG